MKGPFFKSINEHLRALPEQQRPVTAFDPVTEPTDVYKKTQRIRVLLAFLKRDFEAADSMQWALFKQRVDPLIEEVEGLRCELHRQAPTALLEPLHDQLQAVIRTRLLGPNFLSDTDQDS